jgi:hypothetical protein
MSLQERIEKNTELTAYPGEIPVNYLYTYGIAGEKFFRTLKEKGQFTGSKCKSCGVTYVPPRIFCERCFDSIEGVIDIPAAGEVFSFTVCHENVDGSRKEKPDIMAAVKLDVADTVLVHMLSCVNPEKVEIGMKVEAVLKPKKDREGAIFDILHFKPVK